MSLRYWHSLIFLRADVAIFSIFEGVFSRRASRFLWFIHFGNLLWRCMVVNVSMDLTFFKTLFQYFAMRPPYSTFNQVDLINSKLAHFNFLNLNNNKPTIALREFCIFCSTVMMQNPRSRVEKLSLPTLQIHFDFAVDALNVIYSTCPLNYLTIRTGSLLIHLEQCEAVV